MTTQTVKAHLLNEVRERRLRYRPWVALIFCVWLFWAAPRLFRVPMLPGMSGDLSDRPLIDALVVGVLLIGSALAAQFISGREDSDNSLWAASAGLLVLAHRCGAMRYVLFYAHGEGIFLYLAGELVLLYALLFLATEAVRKCQPSPVAIKPDRPADGITTLVTHAAVTGALILILAASDDTQQALFAVGASAFIASLAVQYTFPARNTLWYCGGPLLTGLVGYLIAWHGPTDLATGYPEGSFAALIRPLPLHYASAGTFGAIVGLWTARSWQSGEGNQNDEARNPNPRLKPE